MPGEEFAEGHCKLTTYFWAQKNAAKEPTVSWKYLERNVPVYNPISKKCMLCIREKFNILLNPQAATLNSRQEIFAHCRHMQFELIGRPPG